MKSNNTTINDKVEQFLEIGLETIVTIETLATLTIYNWRSVDTIDNFIFSTTSYIYHNIRYADDNDKSSTLHCHLIQSNSDLSHIQVDIDLINNIDNEIIILWDFITKTSISIMLDTNTEIRDNVASVDNFVSLRITQVAIKFFPTLSNNI